MTNEDLWAELNRLQHLSSQDPAFQSELLRVNKLFLQYVSSRDPDEEYQGTEAIAQILLGFFQTPEERESNRVY